MIKKGLEPQFHVDVKNFQGWLQLPNYLPCELFMHSNLQWPGAHFVVGFESLTE